MAQEILFTSISLQELREELRKIIKEEFKIYVTASPGEPEELKCEKQASKFLMVSKVTLKKWRDEGKIKYYRIGSRIRYKQSDLLLALETNKKFGRS